MIEYRIIKLGVTDSTNDYLKSIAMNDDEARGLVVVADRQTAGKGRLGRSFHSPDGSGCYFSILLRPELKPELLSLITPLAAVAVCRGLKKACGKVAGIKWVNDIFLRDKKIAGILTEAVTGRLSSGEPGIKFLVLGIGINIAAPEGGFPKELEEIAGAVFDEPPACLMSLRDELLEAVLSELALLLDEFEKTRSPACFLDEYRERSIVFNRPVYVVKKDERLKAVALEINDSCELVVAYEDEKKETLRTGEVSLRFN